MILIHSIQLEKGLLLLCQQLCFDFFQLYRHLFNSLHNHYALRVQDHVLFF